MHILVFRLSSLGDVAMCVPVVITALEQNQELKIDFITPKFLHPFFPNHERLSMIDFDKKNQHHGVLGIYKFYKGLNIHQYDGFADLHNVLRSNVFKFLLKTKGIKTATINKGRKEKKNLINHKISQPLTPTTERYANVFRSFGIKVQLDHQLTDFHHLGIPKSKGIGIAPFAAHSGKMYDLESMKEVVIGLHKDNIIKIFGSPEDLDQVQNWEDLENVSLVKESSFKAELKVIAELELMISMDSANMHLASLVGVPVLSIWGVTHPYAGFLGYGQKEEYILQDNTLSWRPTSIYGNKLGPDDNPNGMRNITPHQIITKVETILGL
ncbi:hypothetical protein GO491_08570 [Flavobacteriaceae bacterium Ap0902]|nr:hypothetical protein [Flavobacteriaceae bacterium Ap0902]